jgi:hypothetical protein
VKILRLTNSNDVLSTTNRPEALREGLEEFVGEPVEIVVKTIWPTESLAETVEKWVAKEQPDLVWVGVVNYWYEYMSVPKRMERLFGRFGKKASNLGFKAADAQWLSNNFAFRAMRRTLQATIGGDPHFTPEQVVERIEAVARRVLRSEGVVLAVWGPNAHTKYSIGKRAEKRGEQRRQFVRRNLQRLADSLHFEYYAFAEPGWKVNGKPDFAHDHFHYSSDWGATAAERELEVMKLAISKQRPDLVDRASTGARG